MGKNKPKDANSKTTAKDKTDNPQKGANSKKKRVE